MAKTVAEMVSGVSDRFSLEWDVGTKESEELADCLHAVLQAAGKLSPPAMVEVLATIIEDKMSLDLDDNARGDLDAIVESWADEYFR